jgi:excisionase family DNA binding protein
MQQLLVSEHAWVASIGHGGTAATPDFQYVSVAEAARILSVSPSTVWRWIDAAKLPAYRLGGHTIRIRVADLEAIARPARGANAADTAPADWLRALEPPSDEELERRRMAVAHALAVRSHTPSIAPLTTAQLVRMAREEEEASYDAGDEQPGR